MGSVRGGRPARRGAHRLPGDPRPRGHRGGDGAGDRPADRLGVLRAGRRRPRAPGRGLGGPAGAAGRGRVHRRRLAAEPAWGRRAQGPHRGPGRRAGPGDRARLGPGRHPRVVRARPHRPPGRGERGPAGRRGPVEPARGHVVLQRPQGGRLAEAAGAGHVVGGGAGVGARRGRRLRDARPGQRPHRGAGGGVRRRGPAGHAGQLAAAPGLRGRGGGHGPAGGARVRRLAGPVGGLSLGHGGPGAPEAAAGAAGGDAGRRSGPPGAGQVAQPGRGHHGRVGVVRRERPVAAAILAASLAFRLFALLVPLSYLVVAGLGFAGPDSVEGARPGAGNHLGDLVLSSVAAAARSSQRARWLALIFGGVATLLAAAAVLEVLRWVHLLAWRMAPARSRPNPWLVLGLLGGLAVVSVASTVAESARADAKGLAGELTVVLVSAGVQVLVLAVLWLALSWAMPRPARVPWTALVPGACLFAAGFQGFSLAVGLYFAPRAARASTVYGSLGVAPDPAGVAVPVRPPGRGRGRAQRHPVGAPAPRGEVRRPFRGGRVRRADQGPDSGREPECHL